jgi:hypothetical protein
MFLQASLPLPIRQTDRQRMQVMQQRKHGAVQRRMRIGIALAFDLQHRRNQLVIEFDFFVWDRLLFEEWKCR